MFTKTVKEIYTYTNMTGSMMACFSSVYWKPSVQRASMTCLEILYKDYTCIHDKGVLPDLNVQKPIYLVERGKKRKITPIAFNNRVLQGCMCTHVLTPAFISTLIHANGASLPNKSVMFSRRLFRRYLSEAYRMYGDDFYVISIDIKSYFDSIRHDVCEKILRAKIADEKLIKFCMDFIRSGVEGTDGKGIALGSQVSQLMALFVLSPTDHTAKDLLGARWYIRYMDDIRIFVPTKQEAADMMSRLEESVKKAGLTFNTKKTSVTHIRHSTTFLKFRYRFSDTGKIIDTPVRSGRIRNLRRMRKMAAKIKAGDKSIGEVDQSMNSWLAHNNEGHGYTANYVLLCYYYRCFGVPYGGKQCTT